jgi:hypothetical protein
MTIAKKLNLKIKLPQKILGQFQLIEKFGAKLLEQSDLCLEQPCTQPQFAAVLHRQ